MSIVPTSLFAGLTSFLKGFHIPPCLIIGGKIYGGISLAFFVFYQLTGTKESYNGFRDRVEKGCIAFGLSLIWPVFLYCMFNDDEDDLPLWMAYEAHRKDRENH